jgi:hypothetical protein
LVGSRKKKILHVFQKKTLYLGKRKKIPKDRHHSKNFLFSSIFQGKKTLSGKGKKNLFINQSKPASKQISTIN